MIRNKIPQLMIQVVYVVLGLIVVGSSFGLFEIHEGFRSDFFVQFTNVSNYLCLVVMTIELIYTIISMKNGGYGYTNRVRKLKFMGVVWMISTFCIFNFLLAGGEGRHVIVIDGIEYVSNLPIKDFRIGSILAHIILPILYIVDWVMFYEHGKDKWYAPFFGLIGPVAYIIVVYIRVGIMVALGTPLTDISALYPYPFLAINSVLPLVLLGFLVGFIVVGYSVYGMDKLLMVIVTKYRENKKRKQQAK